MEKARSFRLLLVCNLTQLTQLVIFSPIYRAFREAAISHALERVGETAQKIEGRFNVLEKGLSHKIMSDSVYSEINFHITWLTKSNLPLIKPEIETKLYQFLKHKIIAHFRGLFSRYRRHRRPHTSHRECSAVIVDERVDWTIKRRKFVPY